MNDKEFADLKKKVLPIELQEHFTKNKEVFQNNIKNFEENINKIISLKATDEEKAIFALILHLAKGMYRSADVLLEHNEIAFFSIFTLREEIDRTRDLLNQQGIEIDKISKYDDALHFMDQYIKHSSGDTSLE